LNTKSFILPLFCVSLLLSFSKPLAAEIYIFRGPNGERLISDRPPHPSRNYALVSQHDSLHKLGEGLASRKRIQAGSQAVSYDHYIKAASRKFNVDAALINAVIKVESNFNPNAISKSGATGLMQLMKQTAKQYKVRNRFNPKQNIFGGAEYLSRLMSRYDNKLSLVLAAYNAGPTAVDKHKGVPPFPETLRYIRKVMAALNNS